MLVLSRKRDQSIIIDGNIRITVVGIQGNQVRLGIEAPNSVSIFREELRDRAAGVERPTVEFDRPRPDLPDVRRATGIGRPLTPVPFEVCSPRARPAAVPRVFYHSEGHAMLGSLLIGIDGTDDGGAALTMGIEWARRSHASVTGIGIVDEVGVIVPEPNLFAECFYDQPHAPARTGNRHRVEAALERFARSCDEAGVACRPLRAGGLAFEQILTEAPNHDLILFGQRTHFYDGWEDRCDETLHKVLIGSPRPVVVVPKAPAASGAVVVAYDGSIQASRALAAFEATVLDRSHEVHVVSVAIDRDVASRHAEAAVESLRSREIDALARPIATLRTAAAVILEEAHALTAGLLVMGTHGQPALREFLIGSVTSAILKESDVPIFCFH